MQKPNDTKMKYSHFLLIIGWIISSLLPLHAQVTLEKCKEEARCNFPLVKQHDLIEKAALFNLSNAAKGYLPQITLSGKASYQSDVTHLPIEMPGMEIPSLPKDQYQAVAEIYQSIWDGGETQNRKKTARATTEVERKKLEVDFYTLDERIDQIFFSILLLKEQLEQNSLLQDELKRTATQVESYIRNGIANDADLDAVQVELIGTRQQEANLRHSLSAYIGMLSLFTGEKITTETAFVIPAPKAVIEEVNNRPELSWWEAQQQLYQQQKKNIEAQNRPRIGLFVQGGIGNPGLNMLKDKFSSYYVAGVRLNWNISKLYTRQNDRLLLDNQIQRIENAREQFLFNSRLDNMQKSQGLSALKEQMKDDDELIERRIRIRKAAEAKVKEGTLTVTEMLRELTAENAARSTRSLHAIQLLMKQYELAHLFNQ